MKTQPWFFVVFAGWLVLQCGAALAQEPPEAVYQKLHRAALASNLNEMLRYATDRARAEISAIPGAAEVMKFMATMMPRTYTVTGTTVSPDGGTALLRATGTGSFMGQSSQMHGTVNFLKEKGEWKVDRWEWSDKPGAAAAPVRVQPKPAAAPSPAVAQPQPASPPSAPIQRVVKPAAAPTPTPAPTPAGATPSEPECEIKPVMSDDDLRRCGATPR